MSHSTFINGISEQEAKIAAVLYTDCDPTLLYNLMDPAMVDLEVRRIVLPLAGDVELTIIRTEEGADYTMDLLEHTVRNVEEFMGLLFPQEQVFCWIQEGGGGGLNYGTHVEIGPHEFNVSKEALLGLLAHEASHYYWRSTGPGKKERPLSLGT